ncbi:FKBP-type peptidyl-prolyl cis-trans isomerase [Rickettsiales bacterium]|nr:FKBP-type peptidyl-prolyl cis-trans isomerase [Rickettsiales bacterium]
MFKILPKNKVTLALLFLLAYAYFTNYSYYEDKVIKTDKSEEVSQEKKVKVISIGGGESSVINEAAEYVLNKIADTKKGEVAIKAIIESEMKKQYGDSDLTLVAAKYTNQTKIADILKGENIKARCGDEVSIFYRAYVKDLSEFENNYSDNKPLTFKLGGGATIRGLSHGIVGMQKNGKRKIAIPARYAFEDPKFKNDLISKASAVLYNVELTNIVPKVKGLGAVDVKYSDKVVGEGENIVKCGDNVSIKFRILNSDEADKSYKADFILGGGYAPYGLEQGIIDMQEGGIRNITLYGPFLKIFDKNSIFRKLNLPETKEVIFQVELLK